MINFACPQCNQGFEVEDKAAGKKTKCASSRLLSLINAITLLSFLSGCGPSLESEGPKERIRVGTNGTAPAALAKAAIEDSDTDVRCAAVKTLTDQAVLAKVAIEDKAAGVRKAAVERLTNQTVLERVAPLRPKRECARGRLRKTRSGGSGNGCLLPPRREFAQGRLRKTRSGSLGQGGCNARKGECAHGCGRESHRSNALGQAGHRGEGMVCA